MNVYIIIFVFYIQIYNILYTNSTKLEYCIADLSELLHITRTDRSRRIQTYKGQHPSLDRRTRPIYIQPPNRVGSPGNPQHPSIVGGV